MANLCPKCQRNGGVTHCKTKTCPWTWCTGCNHLHDKSGRSMAKRPTFDPKEP